MEQFKGNENYKFSTPIPNIIGQKYEGYKSTYTKEEKVEKPVLLELEDGQTVEEIQEEIKTRKVTSVVTEADENIQSIEEMKDFRQVEFAFTSYPLPKNKKFLNVAMYVYGVSEGSLHPVIQSDLLFPVSQEMVDADDDYILGKMEKDVFSVDLVLSCIKDIIENHISPSKVYINFGQDYDEILSIDRIQKFSEEVNQDIVLMYKGKIFKCTKSTDKE